MGDVRGLGCEISPLEVQMSSWVILGDLGVFWGVVFPCGWVGYDALITLPFYHTIRGN